MSEEYPGGIQIHMLENQMTTKPADNDHLTIVNISANNEVQELTYGTLKQNFLMTDEDRNIYANIEFQDGYAAKFGNSGDLKILHNGTDSIIRNASNGTKLKIQLDDSSNITQDMMTFDPNNLAIAIKGAKINYDGSSSKGISVAVNGDVTCLQDLIVNLNLGVHGFLNYSGVDGKGIKINTNGTTIFYQNIGIGDNNLNNTGEDGKGIKIATNGDVTFQQKVIVNSTGYPALDVAGDVRASRFWAKSGGVYYDGKSDTFRLIDGVRNNAGTIEYSYIDMTYVGGLLAFVTDYPLWIPA